MQRRTFLRNSSLITAGIVASSALPALASTLFKAETMEQFSNKNLAKRFRPQYKSGFGGVALGNGFNENPDIECLQSIEAAWNEGVRFFDTSPWYGLGISERRMGMFLKDKPREDFTLSTKIGRILKPHEDFKMEKSLWKGKMNFSYQYDYTADNYGFSK